MTVSEALKETQKQVYRNTDNCDMTISKYCYKTAVSALEKQIPKKVVPIQRTAHDFKDDVCKHSHYPCEHLKPFNHEYKYTDYKCPVCGKLAKDGIPSFCWNCGQALDWSDIS